MKVTRKIGQNRGKPRLWLEGAILTAAGFRRGDAWSLVTHSDGFAIVADKNGKRKIAGTVSRPIVDITGASLGRVGLCDTVEVVALPQLVNVKG